MFCSFCDSLIALVDALFFGAQREVVAEDSKKTDIELNSWGTASPAAQSSNGSDSFEDWYLYGTA
jgi:hypothetical protein